MSGAASSEVTQVAAATSSQDPEVGLAAVAALRGLVEVLEALQVDNARAQGWPWQDIADALGVTREPTGRLRHVAHIGVGARGYSYAVHGQTPPGIPVRVELTAPDGSLWTWGPEDAGDRITGPALDFCLLVTQRRHRDDLALAIEGPAAAEWMAIAQAFAGPPGEGRRPGQFRRAT